MCVRERERERKRERVCVGLSKRERERERERVCDYERERISNEEKAVNSFIPLSLSHPLSFCLSAYFSDLFCELIMSFIKFKIKSLQVDARIQWKLFHLLK